MKNLCFVVMASCLVFASCGKENSGLSSPQGETGTAPASVVRPENPVNSDGNGIISEDVLQEDVVFPEGDRARFMSVIKLKSPALLATATENEDGTFTVNEEDKETVLAEQAQLEAELQKISPEIKVLYRYRMVLNGLSIDAPQDLAQEISELDVNFIEADERFARPDVMKSTMSNGNAPAGNAINSMSFIGVDKVHSTLTVEDKDGNLVPVRGKGIKVGVVDSGVDYTHKMLGGPGTEAAFTAIDPNTLPAEFPTSRVVGGYDFAGGAFNPSSHIFALKIPTPDPNPIDQTGHGTHVSGSIAGTGDGVTTFDGAAPDAEIYALKVFGDGPGGTSDQIVIAALEYAADPNGDFSTDDRLDVVNLSLGGGFGKPHNLYSQGVGNLSRGGTVVAASAGNAGAIANIVGAPSTSPDAISIAASVDGMDHNWKFPAVEFVTPTNPSFLAEYVEGTITRPIVLAGPVKGKLVDIGQATEDLTEEQQAALKGHVALIERGEVPFGDKIKRAEDAGAIGVLMVNNEPGPALGMGGDPGVMFNIPGVMVSQSVGSKIRAEMKIGDVSFMFQTPKVIEKPELIDSLAGFSSQGPRDLDALIKPEVSAPGLAIMSAAMGSGDKGVRFSGTSMSSPIVAGVIALVRQYRPNLNSKQVKSLIMNSGKLISDEKGNTYPISRQGAGRVDAYRAVTSQLAFSEAALSLGKIQVETTKTIFRTLQVENVSETPGIFQLSTKNNENIQVSLSQTRLSLEPGEATEVHVSVSVSSVDPKSNELDAFIQILQGEDVVGSLPILAVVNRKTEMSVESLLVTADNLKGSAGATATVTVDNKGLAAGQALLFNLLGQDERKDSTDPFLSVACDLQSSGYKIVKKNGVSVLQVAAKLYNPVTNWRTCDLNVEFDLDGDGETDKEIIGSGSGGLPGLVAPVAAGFGSVLVDTKIINDIYSKYLEAIALQPEQPPGLDFSPSFLDARIFNAFDNSTLAITEVNLAALGAKNTELQVKVSVSYNGNPTDIAERSDSLSDGSSPWKKVSLTETGSGYHNIPESITVAAGGSQTVELLKGDKSEEGLVAYFPRNEFTLLTSGGDQQSQIPEPTFNGPSHMVP